MKMLDLFTLYFIKIRMNLCKTVLLILHCHSFVLLTYERNSNSKESKVYIGNSISKYVKRFSDMSIFFTVEISVHFYPNLLQVPSVSSLFI